jgi:hypothetical protein
MGARIVRWLQQRRKLWRFVLLLIAIDRLFILRDNRAAEESDSSPSGAGCSRKHRPNWQYGCQGHT